MLDRKFRPLLQGAAAIALTMGLFSNASAETIQIQVANYNGGMSGQIWAVALEKGFLKEEGLDVEIRSSTGGAGDVRALIAGDLPYVETGVTGVYAAVAQGNDIKMVSDNAMSVASTFWFAKADSPVNTLKDLKGHKLSYSNPKSTTHMVDLMLLKKLGYTENDVTLVAAGGISASLTMMEAGGIDVVTAGNQIFYDAPAGKYKLIGKVADELPPTTNVVGVATAKAIAEKPDVIRKLIAARRKAVEFTEAHPDEAAEMMAKVAGWNVEVTKKVVRDLVGGKFWSKGAFGPDMDNAIEGLVLVGALDKPVDWKALVDEQFLPDDQKTLTKK